MEDGCPVSIARRSLSSSALSLASSLSSRTWGRVVRRVGPGARWGAGSIPWRVLGWAKVRREKPNGNTSKHEALG